MAHMQRATSKNWLRWFRTIISNFQYQVTNFNANNISSNYTASNQFITTREAEILAKQVDRSSDTIAINAIGGNVAYFLGKRIIDVVAATIIMILLLPMLITCAIWVAVENTGLVFNKKQEFTSRLIKRNGQYVWIVVPFTRYEFLTTGATSGQFLQATGLNALPELINVIRDEMSIVGAETLTQEDIETFEDWQFLSVACKPGIIGLSRISGKLSWLANDRTRQEVWYACNQSLSIDFKILVKTFRSVMVL